MQIKLYLKKLSESPKFKAFTGSFLAILFGLLIGLVLLIITNPGEAFQGFIIILSGCFGEVRTLTGVGYFLRDATPILLTGLSVAFAFKTGLFNIGATGQFTVGMFASLVFALSFPQLASIGVLYWILCVLAGVLAGAFWGFFPGILKATLNVNEVITSIMFNYIGMYLVNMIIQSSSKLYNSEKVITAVPPKAARTPILGLNKIFPSSGVDISIIIAIAIAILIYFILNKTTFGYELKACGFNKNASRYAGINEKRSITLSMMIAGGLAGIAGAFYILRSGSIGAGTYYKPVDEILSYGFDGIPVALLGFSNPIGVIFSTFFISYIKRGGYYMQSLSFRFEIIDIMLAIIIYFSAFALIIRTLIAKRIAKKKHSQNQLFLATETPQLKKEERS